MVGTHRRLPGSTRRKVRLDHLLSKEQSFMAARSVPECGTAGAQGWNIDYLAPTWSSLTSTSWSPSGGSAVERGSGPGRCLTRCWVLKDRATPPAARECGRAGVGGFLLVGGPHR